MHMTSLEMIRPSFALLLSAVSLAACVTPVVVGKETGSGGGATGTTSPSTTTATSSSTGQGVPVSGLVALRHSASNAGAPALVRVDPMTGVGTQISATTA